MNLFYGNDLKRIEVVPCVKLDLLDLCLIVGCDNWALNISCPGLTVIYMGKEDCYRKVTYKISPRLGILPELTGDITIDAESMQDELLRQKNEIAKDGFLVRVHGEEI